MWDNETHREKGTKSIETPKSRTREKAVGSSHIVKKTSVNISQNSKALHILVMTIDTEAETDGGYVIRMAKPLWDTMLVFRFCKWSTGHLLTCSSKRFLFP